MNVAVRKQALTVPLPAPRYWQSLHQHTRVTRGADKLFPANCRAEASTCYRHNFFPRNKGKILSTDATSERTGPAIIRASARLPVLTCDVTPNLSVNTDAPFAALRARTGSPVTFVR